jgi:hypothetical protein
VVYRLGFGLRTALSSHKISEAKAHGFERFERLEPFEQLKLLSTPKLMMLLRRKPKQ